MSECLPAAGPKCTIDLAIELNITLHTPPPPAARCPCSDCAEPQCTGTDRPCGSPPPAGVHSASARASCCESSQCFRHCNASTRGTTAGRPRCCLTDGRWGFTGRARASACVRSFKARERPRKRQWKGQRKGSGKAKEEPWQVKTGSGMPREGSGVPRKGSER